MAPAKFERYVIALIQKAATSEEATFDSTEVISTSKEDAVEKATEWVGRLAPPVGEYVLQVTKNGVGVRTIKIVVKS